MPDATRTALLAGATGLVGSHCLSQLLSDPAYGRVVAVVRRPALRSGSMSMISTGATGAIVLRNRLYHVSTVASAYPVDFSVSSVIG